MRRLIAVIDTGSPVSALSPNTVRALEADGLIQPGAQPNRYRLSALTAEGQELPDLEVAVIRRLDRLEIEALLGLDFLTQFARIHFDTRSMELILEPL